MKCFDVSASKFRITNIYTFSSIQIILWPWIGLDGFDFVVSCPLYTLDRIELQFWFSVEARHLAENFHWLFVKRFSCLPNFSTA